jgi:Mg2+ and Co2+ transporter CorA
MAVQCIVYQNGEPGGEIPIADISEALQQEGTFVWLALHEPDAAVLRQIQEEFALHDLAVKRLAGWGAILAIPTVVFSLYGMNFRFMPELGWRFGYPLVLAGTVTGCLLLYWKLKRAEWL